jgi:hypothetical protein
MTGISAVCVAIARPYAPRIPGRARHDARLSGTADLPFRTITVMPEPPVTTGEALLMRLGGNTLRGSNPRSSGSEQQLRPTTPTSAGCCFLLSGVLRGHRRHQVQFLPRC